MLRQVFGWVVVLAGYKATPAKEMLNGAATSGGTPLNICKECGDDICVEKEIYDSKHKLGVVLCRVCFKSKVRQEIQGANRDLTPELKKSVEVVRERQQMATEQGFCPMSEKRRKQNETTELLFALLGLIAVPAWADITINLVSSTCTNGTGNATLWGYWQNTQGTCHYSQGGIISNATCPNPTSDFAYVTYCTSSCCCIWSVNLQPSRTIATGCVPPVYPSGPFYNGVSRCS